MHIINPLGSRETYVYHYTKHTTALDYILNQGTLQLNPFSGVNDPRENKAWRFALELSDWQGREIEEWDRASDKISSIIKGKAKLACFSMDRQTAVGKCQPDGLPDRGFARPSMWHHYGEEHKGVCLIFDRKKLDVALRSQINEKMFSAEVQYSDDGVIRDLRHHPFTFSLVDISSSEEYFSRLNRHVSEWLPELFFRKLQDWQNEEEYRWVYFDEDNKPPLLNFQDALEGIILGENFPKDREEDIFRYCAIHGADVARLVWENGFPKVSDLGSPYITHRHLIGEC